MLCRILNFSLNFVSSTYYYMYIIICPYFMYIFVYVRVMLAVLMIYQSL